MTEQASVRAQQQELLRSSPMSLFAATRHPRRKLAFAIFVNLGVVAIIVASYSGTGVAGVILSYVIFASLGATYLWLAIWSLRHPEEAAAGFTVLRSKYRYRRQSVDKKSGQS